MYKAQIGIKINIKVNNKSGPGLLGRENFQLINFQLFPCLIQTQYQ